MKVKIDTKEKMHVITLEEQKLTENMTGDFKKTILEFLNKPVSNVVVNFMNVQEIELSPANALVSVQQTFYDANHSIVFCNLDNSVSDYLDKNELLELLNVTPTESEAWDIVQMEEIEREFL
ncbi:MAG: STAS domain-containing protein [Ginsengibacter sp.]